MGWPRNTPQYEGECSLLNKESTSLLNLFEMRNKPCTDLKMQKQYEGVFALLNKESTWHLTPISATRNPEQFMRECRSLWHIN